MLDFIQILCARTKEYVIFHSHFRFHHLVCFSVFPFKLLALARDFALLLASLPPKAKLIVSKTKRKMRDRKAEKITHTFFFSTFSEPEEWQLKFTRTNRTTVCGGQCDGCCCVKILWERRHANDFQLSSAN